MTAAEGIRNQELGRFGEDRAAAHLISEGYRIVKKNFRSRLGEIDIIAEKEGCTVFAEVKLRKNDTYGSASEFVSVSKQRKLRLTAEYYLMLSSAQDSLCRFDVIEIYAPHGADGEIEIRHIEDAFS